MDVNSLFNETKAHFDKATKKFQDDLNQVRTGRPHASMFDRIFVDYYGNRTPINQVANITLPEPRMFVIQAWEHNMLTPIEKAIATSDLKLNPVNDGKVLKIAMPPLSEERRKEYVKLVKKMCEEAKVVARNIRRDANEAVKKLEKDKVISTDDSKKAQEKIQKMTDETTVKIDQMTASKEKEIMTV